MRLRSTITIIIASLFLFPAYSTGQVAKTIVRQIIKKEIKQAKKIGTKKVTKLIEKKAGKESQRSMIKTVSKSTTIGLSSKVAASMTKEVAEVFKKGAYSEINVIIRGRSKPLLISPKFDPYLKISRKYTGDFDPVKFHKGNPRFVKDGCETNLGRMKRGLAPLYKDPSNQRIADHGYSAFELHHGGQKSNPNYFALMAEDHKTQSSVLHPIRKGSEINRGEFSKKERAPMYKEIADYIDYIL
ncbi:HNH/ENDO VII family nuclease [uncultured Duncaniella sp.]|uniref:HNH/ENDO VII family nuclease n=1 Tax=uncultured Duncaniella sp. TaxID=2768039 RepID=UPI0025F8CBF3|nr:HNH/ENDO VII family nuclease [uncultured Duncaniella sp.]